MPANLTNPFGESCCDGGECSTNELSAQSCGCDPGLKPQPWVCQFHQNEARIQRLIKEKNESTD